MTQFNNNIKGFYINLDERKDRNKTTKYLLKKLKLKDIERFSAIKDERGLVGCYLSHISCLKLAREREYERCIIFEDDITCKNINKTRIKINDIYFNETLDYDVFMIGCWYYNKKCYKTIPNSNILKINKAVCNHSYIVNNKYYDTIINHLEEGLKLYLSHNCADGQYNNDEYLGHLQLRDNWYSYDTILISQYDGYSDNFKETRNYQKRIYNIPSR
tara:strand:+ start:50 stop:700 length:651 start_codon:yes stop_codon:yes gene_type:complete